MAIFLWHESFTGDSFFSGSVQRKVCKQCGKHHLDVLIIKCNILNYYLICLSFCPHEGGGAMWPLPMMHWTSLNRVPSGPSPNPPPYIGPHCLGIPIGDIWCSNLFTLKPTLSQCWHLVAIEEECTISARRWYASYWDAFLLDKCFDIYFHFKI